MNAMNAMNIAPLVCLNTADSKKSRQIETFCRKNGYRYRKITPADAGRPAGNLAGIKAPAAAAQAAPAKMLLPDILPELMILYGFSDGALDAFLDSYKKAGIEPVALKAILTPYNFTWTLRDLVSELMRERGRVGV